MIVISFNHPDSQLNCRKPKTIIAFLQHGHLKIGLGLWDDKPRPKANPPPAAELEYIIEDAVPSADDIAIDPIYPAETYF